VFKDQSNIFGRMLSEVRHVVESYDSSPQVAAWMQKGGGHLDLGAWTVMMTVHEERECTCKHTQRYAH
jgi:hypothetical protein